jgi:3-oxoacyl-[acyl-carrier-protein] synthase II
MSISIIGIGTVSSLGSGIESLKAGLEGRVPPLMEDIKIATDKGEIPLRVYRARTEGLERFVAKRSLRRTDSFSKMSLLSSYLAVEDAQVEFEDKKRVGIVFGSGYGPLQTTFDFIDGLIDDGDRYASPTSFANSVHNCLASQVSISMKLNGPTQTITCFSQTAINVFLTAQLWLYEGICDFVLAGVGDEYCAVRGYATAGLGASDCPGIRPFCFDQCTFLPGEGFATFLVARDSSTDRGYGKLENIIAGKRPERMHLSLLDSMDALFISANGNRTEAKAFKGLDPAKKKVGAYSPLYGGLPVGPGFDIAIALLSLKEKRLYASPDSGTDSGIDWDIISADQGLGENPTIGCVGYGRGGCLDLVTLAGE